MREKVDICLYISVGLMFVVFLLAIASAFYEPINQSDEYKRGYLDGFVEGMSMCDIDYGTIKLERKGGEE